MRPTPERLSEERLQKIGSEYHDAIGGDYGPPGKINYEKIMSVSIVLVYIFALLLRNFL